MAEKEKRRNPEQLLTLPEALSILRVERATFYRWKATGKAPKHHKLPGGSIRLRRRDLDAFLDNCIEEVETPRNRRGRRSAA